MRCNATKEDGTNCSAHALANSSFCFFHDPERADDRKHAQSKGGKPAGEYLRPLDLATLKTADELSVFLRNLIKATIVGQVSTKSAQALGYNIQTLFNLTYVKDQAVTKQMDGESEKIRQSLTERFGERSAEVILNPGSRRRILDALEAMRRLYSPAFFNILMANNEKAEVLAQRELEEAMDWDSSIVAT